MSDKPQDSWILDAKLEILKENSRLCETNKGLTEALRWALRHVSKHGTATYEENLRLARIALAKAEGRTS